MCEFTLRFEIRLCQILKITKKFYLGKTGLGAVGGSPVGVGENGRET